MIRENLDLLIPNEVDEDRLMSMTWGTVEENGQVMLDSDRPGGVPLPLSTPTLVPLVPGERVAVDRLGRGVRVTGRLLRQGFGIWVELSLDNGWVNNTDGLAPARAMREGPWVTLDGAVKGGTAAGITVLPELFRPTYTKFLPSSVSQSPDTPRIRIYPSGLVISGMTGVGTYLSLDGIRFPLD